MWSKLDSDRWGFRRRENDVPNIFLDLDFELMVEIPRLYLTVKSYSSAKIWLRCRLSGRKMVDFGIFNGKVIRLQDRAVDLSESRSQSVA